MITIIDYGMGNIASIQNMLKKIGSPSIITDNKEEIEQAEKIILPGVGAFDTAMSKIEEKGLRAVLEKKALHDKIPFLGICLGMQLLTKGSEEGKLPGLGWINAFTRKFSFEQSSLLKVPHMGWNLVKKSGLSALTEDFTENFRFYHVHSYFVRVENEQNSILKTIHGIEFDSGIRQENIYGVQFHPEKSHKFGLKLFQNFVNI